MSNSKKSTEQLNAQIKHVSPSKLKIYLKNPRRHSDEKVRKLAASIKNFGFLVPVAVDEKYEIIAGHARYEAAQKLGLKKIPVVLYDHLSEKQKKAFRIADNRLTELADWEYDLLKTELQNLIELDFEVELTGFSTAEIDFLIDFEGIDQKEKPDVDNEFIGIDLEKEPVSKHGDLWYLNEHRLLCGNAVNKHDYTILMEGRKANMVFTDPPYNVPIQGHVCGKGAKKHREFVQASGEMSKVDFLEFLKNTFNNTSSCLIDGALVYCCMDWRSLFELENAARSAELKLFNICVWNKNNGGMGSFYRSKHEFVVVYKHGQAAHINNIELGRNGRYRTNVWDYAGVNTFKKERSDELSMHPTVKPVGLVADAIRDCTKHKQYVLDPFVGSGSTIIAAEKTNRIAYGMELDPLYVDTAIRRWQDYTGEKAIHAETKQIFAE